MKGNPGKFHFYKPARHITSLLSFPAVIRYFYRQGHANNQHQHGQIMFDKQGEPGRRLFTKGMPKMNSLRSWVSHHDETMTAPTHSRA